MTGETGATMTTTARGGSLSPRIPLGDRTPVRSPPTTSSPAGEEGRSQSPTESHQRQRSQGPRPKPATHHQSCSPANVFTPARTAVSHLTIKRVATCGTTTTSELAEKSEGCVGGSSGGASSFRSAKSTGSTVNKAGVLPSSLAKTIARKTAEELASKESEIQELKLKANEHTEQDLAQSDQNPNCTSLQPPQVKKLEEQSLEDQKESVRKSIVISQLREENTRISNGNWSSSSGGTQQCSPKGNGEPALTPGDESRSGRNSKAAPKEGGRRGSSIPRDVVKSSLEDRGDTLQRTDAALKLQRREFQDLEAGTRKLTLMRKDLEDAVSELRTSKHHEQQLLAGLKAEIGKLTQDLETLKEKAAGERARLEVVTADLEDRREKEKEARKVIEKLETDILDAQAKLKDLQEKIISEQADLSKVEIQMGNNKKKQSEILDQKTKSEAQLEALKIQMGQSKATEKTTQENVTKLRKEETVLNESRQKAEAALDTQRKALEDLQRQSEVLRAKTEDLTKELAGKEETKATLQTESATLGERLEQMRMEKTQLAQEITVQNDQIRKFHSDWKETSKELEIEQRKVAGFKDSTNRLQKQIGERKATLRLLEGRLSTLEANEKNLVELAEQRQRTEEALALSRATESSKEEARLVTLRQEVADMEQREVELKARLESYYGKTEELSQHLIVMRFARPADDIPSSKTHQLQELPEEMECCADDFTLRPWSSVPVSDGGTWEQHYEQRMKMMSDFRRHKDLDEADAGRQEFEAALMECRIAEQRAAQERIQELDDAIKLRDEKLATYEAQQHDAEGQVMVIAEELVRGETHLRDIESKISTRLSELQGLEAKMSKASDVYERLKIRITVKQREASCLSNQQPWLNNPKSGGEPPSDDPHPTTCQGSNEKSSLLGEDPIGIIDRRSPQTLSPYSPRADEEQQQEEFPERVHYQVFSPCMDGGLTESTQRGGSPQATGQLPNSLNVSPADKNRPLLPLQTEFVRDRSWQRELYVKSANQRDLFWKQRCSSELETSLAAAALKNVAEHGSSRRATFDFHSYHSPAQTLFQREGHDLGVTFAEGGAGGMLYCSPSYEDTTTTPTFREESLLSGRVRSTSSGAGEFAASSTAVWN